MLCLTMTPWGHTLPGIWANSRNTVEKGRELALLYEDVDSIYKEFGQDVMPYAKEDRPVWKDGFVLLTKVGPLPGTILLLNMVDPLSFLVDENEIELGEAEILKEVISQETKGRIAFLIHIYEGGFVSGPDWKIDITSPNEWKIRDRQTRVG